MDITTAIRKRNELLFRACEAIDQRGLQAVSLQQIVDSQDLDISSDEIKFAEDQFGLLGWAQFAVPENRSLDTENFIIPTSAGRVFAQFLLEQGTFSPSTHSQLSSETLLVLGTLLYLGTSEPFGVGYSAEQVFNVLKSTIDETSSIENICSTLNGLGLTLLVPQKLVRDAYDETNARYVLTPVGYWTLLNNLDLALENSHSPGNDWPREVMNALYDARDAIFASDEQPRSNQNIPATNRYVRRSDNQIEFDDVVARLSRIRDEFASDHFRTRNSTENYDAILQDMETYLMQATTGVVNWFAAQGLVNSLIYLTGLMGVTKEFVTGVQGLIDAISKLFGF